MFSIWYNYPCSQKKGTLSSLTKKTHFSNEKGILLDLKISDFGWKGVVSFLPKFAKQGCFSNLGTSMNECFGRERRAYQTLNSLWNSLAPKQIRQWVDLHVVNSLSRLFRSQTNQCLNWLGTPRCVCDLPWWCKGPCTWRQIVVLTLLAGEETSRGPLLHVTWINFNPFTEK